MVGDVEALIRRRMQDRSIGFKQALNGALREALGAAPSGASFRTGTADLGLPSVTLDRALQLAADLEDEELLRKMRRGK